jgi:hypothetical protein
MNYACRSFVAVVTSSLARLRGAATTPAQASTTEEAMDHDDKPGVETMVFAAGMLTEFTGALMPAPVRLAR